jgi:hypothetical protein
LENARAEHESSRTAGTLRPHRHRRIASPLSADKRRLHHITLNLSAENCLKLSSFSQQGRLRNFVLVQWSMSEV